MGNVQFPQLRDKEWWEKNWDNSNNTLAGELGCSLGTVHNWRRRLGVSAYTRAPPLIGKEAEDYVADRIEQLGGKTIAQDVRSPFDLDLDGIRIDVKSASPGGRAQYHDSPSYGFALGKSVHKDCDFYILVVKHPGDWACFIVPAYAVLEGKNSISFKWPAHHPKMNPWARYLERWDLLGLLE